MPAHRPRTAGGFPIALGAIGGAAIGFVLREPTLWFFIGTGTGIAVAVLIWLLGRR